MSSEEYTKLFYEIESAKDVEVLKTVLLKMLNKISDISDQVAIKD
jgi:hypothetical protein